MSLETVARDLIQPWPKEQPDYVALRKVDADLLIGLARKVEKLNALWDQAYEDDVVLTDALDELFVAWDLLQEMS